MSVLPNNVHCTFNNKHLFKSSTKDFIHMEQAGVNPMFHAYCMHAFMKQYGILFDPYNSSLMN